MKRDSVQPKDIERVLSRADPKLGKLIAAVVPRVGPLRLAPPSIKPFEALVRAIVFQQLAWTAATAIYKRLRLATRGAITVKKILALSHDELKAAGLSNAKAKYVHNLATWFDDNRKIARGLATMSNDEVIAALTSIGGIGIWTANVFLIFNLQRADVVPTTDFGIRKAIQFVYGLKKMPTFERVEQMSRNWRPYRSIASMYLWHAIRLKLKAGDLR